MSEKPSLAKKLHAIMSKAEYVQKKGWNDFHRYKFAQEADFIELIKPLMVQEGVIALPSFDVVQVDGGLKTQKGDPYNLVTLRLTLTFRDTDSDESLSVSVIGQGADNQDKGAYKALTGAMKYALAKTFLVPTGDDPEHEEEGKPHAHGAPPPEATKAPPKAKDGQAKGGYDRTPFHELPKWKQDFLSEIGKEKKRIGEDAVRSVLNGLNFPNAPAVPQEQVLNVLKKLMETSTPDAKDEVPF